jgi:AraC-like DNA-binding protein
MRSTLTLVEPLPGLRMIGVVSLNKSGDRHLIAHRHRSCWEVCWLARGSAEWWALSEEHVVTPNRFWLTRPGEPHGAVSEHLEPGELYWMQFDLAGARATLADGGVALRRGLQAITRRLIAAPASTTLLWRDLLAQCQGPERHGNLGRQGAFHRLLAALLDAAAAPAPEAADPRLMRAMAWARERSALAPTATAMAAAVAMPRAVFQRSFRAATGMPPADWLRRERLRLAKARLRAGDSVTSVAFTLGYATTQHFATQFRRYTGLTPSAWRDLPVGRVIEER